MRIVIAAVGRVRAGAEKPIYESYIGRLPWPTEVREVEERRRLSAGERRSAEARLLVDAVPAEATVVALDEGGEALSSAQFAERLRRWREQGVRSLAFLIGGADGHGKAVLRRADLVLSLGPMTWPHLLVRVMLAEQLYRAAAILSGHPYHRA